MKEPLDELLVQACAAQQRADLAALEQLEPANVPMPFVPQVRRTPRRLLKAAMIAAVCAALVTTVYAFWPEVAVILEGSRAYLAVQEAPQTDIPMEQMQLTYVPEGCTVAWDDSTYQKYGVYSCLIDNGKQGREQQLLGIAQMPLESKVNIQGSGPDDAITEEDEENIAQQLENRVSFRRAMKSAMSRTMKAGALGIKASTSGRLGGADMARTEFYSEGTIPLQTLRADIDYGFAEADTTYGKVGVKVWIYNGEILPTKEGSDK